MQPTQTTRTGFWGALDNAILTIGQSLPLVDYFWNRDARLEAEQKKIEESQKILQMIVILVFVFLAVMLLVIRKK